MQHTYPYDYAGTADYISSTEYSDDDLVILAAKSGEYWPEVLEALCARRHVYVEVWEDLYENIDQIYDALKIDERFEELTKSDEAEAAVEKRYQELTA